MAVLFDPKSPRDVSENARRCWAKGRGGTHHGSACQYSVQVSESLLYSSAADSNHREEGERASSSLPQAARSDLTWSDDVEQ